MKEASIPVVDLKDLRSGGPRRAAFVRTMGDALRDIGFFAVRNHDVTPDAIALAYEKARAFFALPLDQKRRYELAAKKGQRGFTSFGKEHAKGSQAPDLKEFWQVGRTDVPDDHPVHGVYGGNLWPEDVTPGFQGALTRLYEGLESLGRELLLCCAEYLEEETQWYEDAAMEGDTILRVIHYPPVAADAAVSSIRAAAHEDINLITLLCGATAEGLELLQRDGSWLPVVAGHDEIIVDAGDMLQNVTNGLFKSTTHRVVRPAGELADQPRFSMPCFLHPRGDVDLTPRSRCLDLTGGTARYPSITAGEYLAQRLREIGLA
ncbi:MAG: isopenicillin N synthase family dioxygenase [Myxococcota bacterium]